MTDADTAGRCRGLLAVYALRMARLDQQADTLDGGEPSGGPSDRAGLSTPSEYLRGQREAIAWARELLEDALGDLADPPAEQTTGERWQDVARCIATGVHQVDAGHPFTGCPVVKVVGEFPAGWLITSRDTGGSLFDLPIEQRYHLGGYVGGETDATNDGPAERVEGPGEQP